MRPSSVRTYESSEKSGSIKHWLRHIDLLATVNAWSATQKCAVAIANLKGPAAFWLDSFTFDSWQDFQAGIKERFGDDPDQVLDKLLLVKHGQRESLEDYVDRFNVMLSSCADAGNVVPAILCVKLFIDGLQPHVRLKVKERRPEDLNEAISDAKYFAGELKMEADAAAYYADFNQDSQGSACVNRDMHGVMFNT